MIQGYISPKYTSKGNNNDDGSLLMHMNYLNEYQFITLMELKAHICALFIDANSAYNILIFTKATTWNNHQTKEKHGA